jgi:Co/Zn/Cd efflux system component
MIYLLSIIGIWCMLWVIGHRYEDKQSPVSFAFKGLALLGAFLFAIFILVFIIGASWASKH